MASLTFNINALATALMLAGREDSTQFRVRTLDDGALQVRPTNRASKVNLPKGEVLTQIRVKSPTSRRFSLPEDIGVALEAGRAFGVTAAKYGWFTLLPAEGAVEGPAVRVSDR